MNLNRIGNWAADNYEQKQKRIENFLDQTSDYIESISRDELPAVFKKTFNAFVHEFSVLNRQTKKSDLDKAFWAEKMMTWGNILTHRSQLVK